MSSESQRSVPVIIAELRAQIHTLTQLSADLVSRGDDPGESPVAAAIDSTSTALEALGAELELATTDDDDLSQSGRHLLIADDTEVNRVVALSQLERLGHTGQMVVDGQQALDLLLTERFDAVLMDWHMPELDGLEAAQEYYEHCDATGIEPIPIIMMTANVSDEARQTCAQAGTTDFLPKPVSLDALRTCLDRWLGFAAPAPSIPELAFIDRTMIEQMVDDLGGADALAPVIGAFLADADQRHAAIQPPASQDRAEARRASHTLKSTAALLGAQSLSVASKELEQLFDADQSPDEQTLNNFNETLAATIAELKIVQTELESR